MKKKNIKIMNLFIFFFIYFLLIFTFVSINISFITFLYNLNLCDINFNFALLLSRIFARFKFYRGYITNQIFITFFNNVFLRKI